jgi:hypothetical protein
MSIPGFTAEAIVDGSPDRQSEGSKQARHRISVPGFISSELGLGDVIARITSAAGISPCGGCRRRAQALNAWVSFVPRR